MRKKGIALLADMLKCSTNRNEGLLVIQLALEVKDRVPEALKCVFLNLLPPLLQKRTSYFGSDYMELVNLIQSFICIAKSNY